MLECSISIFYDSKRFLYETQLNFWVSSLFSKVDYFWYDSTICRCSDVYLFDDMFAKHKCWLLLLFLNSQLISINMFCDNTTQHNHNIIQKQTICKAICNHVARSRRFATSTVTFDPCSNHLNNNNNNRNASSEMDYLRLLRELYEYEMLFFHNLSNKRSPLKFCSSFTHHKW